MKFKNKILAILLLVVMVFSFVGCAECISTEYKDVQVTVVDKYHRSVWVQPIIAGKVRAFITHPEVWEITVEYKNVNYTINDRDTYNKYKDKIGQAVCGELKIETYDDGTVKYDVVSLK